MKYPFKVYQAQVEDHVFWIAESLCLNGCIGQGDTNEEAISALEENEVVWLETAKEDGIKIPPIPDAEGLRADLRETDLMVKQMRALHKEYLRRKMDKVD